MSYESLSEMKQVSKNIVTELLKTECSGENELQNVPCDSTAWCKEAYDRSKSFLECISARRYFNLYQHTADFWSMGYPNASPLSVLSFANEEQYEAYTSEMEFLCRKYNLIFMEQYYNNIDKTVFETSTDYENISFNIFARAMSFGDKMDKIFEAMANDPEVIEFINSHREEDDDCSNVVVLKKLYFDIMNEFIMEIPFASMGDSPLLNTAASIQNALVVNAVAAKAINNKEYTFSAIKACESLMDNEGFESIEKSASQKLIGSDDMTEDEGMSMV